MLFTIDERVCIDCGACRRYCPVDAVRYDLQHRIELEKCIGCTICYAVCPVDAVRTVESPRYPARPDLARPTMLRARWKILKRKPRVGVF